MSIREDSIVYFVDEIRTPFVINDIRRVAERYERVYLFSVDSLQGKEALPENVVVFEEFIDWRKFRPLKILLANFFSVLSIYLAECFALKKILPPKRAFAVLASNIFKAEQIQKIVKNIEPSGSKFPPPASNLSPIASSLQPKPSNLQPPAYYSFWFYDCIYLAWMRKKGWIDKAVTRAHSGDLYEDHISIRNKILLRNFQFKYLDSVLPISQMGTEYFKKKYPKAKARIDTIFLGSNQKGINPFPKDEFILVSCASFRHHKRVHKIAEMLLKIDFPLTWIHFGDERLDSNDPKIGEYKKKKEQLLKTKPNIKYVPMGYQQNEKVLEYYLNNPVSLFVSLSAVEGIPVSMMEAISFGIPILSTDVGGCKEIVNEKTGILIPLETSMEEVAEIITEFKDSSKNSIEFRKGVREFWEEHFDADKNYGKLFEEIVG